jgi:hypothetical protein
MGQTISTQHPAVVLRSRYRQLRALLAVAMIAVIGLTVAVVILADDDNSNIRVVSPSQVSPGSTAATRSDGGPEESAVAGALHRQATAPRPDESVVANAISGRETAPRPDEAAVASAISGH